MQSQFNSWIAVLLFAPSLARPMGNGHVSEVPTAAASVMRQPFQRDGRRKTTTGKSSCPASAIPRRLFSAGGSSSPAAIPTRAGRSCAVWTPLIYDNRIFLWTDAGGVSCRRLDTGALVWKEQVGGSYYASPVWVNHCLCNVARNGKVAVVAAGDKFEVLGRMPLGELSYATPAVAGGVMYLRTRSRLFSLGGNRQPKQSVGGNADP